MGQNLPGKSQQQLADTAVNSLFCPLGSTACAEGTVVFCLWGWALRIEEQRERHASSRQRQSPLTTRCGLNGQE